MIHEVPAEDSDLLAKYDQATVTGGWEPIYNYELYAISVHQGSMGGGHYCAYISHKIGEERQWFYCSDS